MSTGIRTRIIKIGNSQGVRIPKPLIEQSGLQSDVEILVEGDQITIRNVASNRNGWAEAFATMAQQQDDTLLAEPTATDWEQSEWEW